MINAIYNLQFYAQKVEVEHEDVDCLVTLEGVIVSELHGQVSIDDLLDNLEYDVIADYLARRKKEDEE